MLNENEVRILGFKKGHSKKTSEIATILYFEKPFEKYEISSEDYECLGMAVGDAYIRKDLTVHVGDVGEIVYRVGFDKKALAVDFRVSSPAPVKDKEKK